ncbi:MAG: hypothetical protein Q8P54_00400 [bacterium]|nr:hypothetical protein [bacterium]
MQFFIPHTPKTNQLATYQSIIDAIKYQLGCKITDRKIYSLRYTHDKKDYSAIVGQLEQIENRYKVLAIIEANLYVVFARAVRTHDILTILVNKDEVHTIEDFA